MASAAERFRAGLSSVSHGVLDGAKRIPRSVWRMTLLGVVGAIVLILAVWGCIALYKVTSPGPREPQPQDQASDVTPQAVDAAKPTAKPADKPKDATKAKPANDSKAKPKDATKAKPAADSKAKPDLKKATLRSTGQKIPPLYVD